MSKRRGDASDNRARFGGAIEQNALQQPRVDADVEAIAEQLHLVLRHQPVLNLKLRRAGDVDDGRDMRIRRDERESG
jgi:hypothetical protein